MDVVDADPGDLPTNAAHPVPPIPKLNATTTLPQYEHPQQEVQGLALGDREQNRSISPSALPQEILDIVIAYDAVPADDEPPYYSIRLLAEPQNSTVMSSFAGRWAVNRASYSQAKSAYIEARKWCQRVLPAQWRPLRVFGQDGEDQESEGQLENYVETTLLLPATTHLLRLQLDFETRDTEYQPVLIACIDTLLKQLPLLYPRLQELTLHLKGDRLSRPDHCATESLWWSTIKDTIGSPRRSAVAKRHISFGMMCSCEICMCDMFCACIDSANVPPAAPGTSVVDSMSESPDDVVAEVMSQRLVLERTRWQV